MTVRGSVLFVVLLFLQSLYTHYVLSSVYIFIEFVMDMQSQISVLKQDWTRKLDDFTQRHLKINPNQNNNSASGSNNSINRMTIMNPHPHNNPLLPLTPFRVLLQLFAYEDVIDSGKLDAVFEMDQGQSLTFFVPQLLSFLLHGAYYETDPTKLEAWILEKCSLHVHFAHRCYWFLRAWSLEQSLEQAYDEQPTTAHSTGALLLEPSSSEPDCFPLTPANHQPATISRRYSRSNSWSSINGGMNNTSSKKLLPEEREAVEDLMLRIVQVGEASARILQFGPLPKKTYKRRRGKRDKIATPQKQKGQQPPTDDGLFWDQEDESGNVIQRSPSGPLVPELVLTPEMERSLPVDPNTGFPSHRHLETLTASQRYGFLSVKKQQEAMANPSATLDTFQATPRFLDALLAIADGLFLVPREQRKRELRQQLQNLEVEMLPSNAVYVPISNMHHRVWRVVADESIALNTKERVPCIILLEVVDYSSDGSGNNESDEAFAKTADDLSEIDDEVPALPTREGGKRTRSLELPKLDFPKLSMPKKANRSTIGGELVRNLQHSDVSSVGFNNASASGPLQFSMPYYTMMGGLTELEIVNDWRYGKRHPHRGESILDKMTSLIPLDMHRMKERMIHQLRDKPIFHDLLARGTRDDLSVSFGPRRDPSLTRNGDCEIAAFLCNDGVYENTRMLPDLEAKKGRQDDDERPARDFSPERDTVEAVSMGQWMSPTKARPRISLLNPKDMDFLPSMSGTGSEASEKSSGHKRKDSKDRDGYGSTYEGRGQPAPANAQNGRPPRTHARTNSAGVSAAGLNTLTSPRTGSKKPPQQVVFRENWQAKEDRLRPKSAFGSHPGWRLLPVLVKANDDLRQEQLASQLIQRMAFILARERVPVWLCPYEILAITNRGGIVEAIPDTISLDSLKRNDPNFVDLKTFFHSYFGDSVDELADAKSNFVESLAAYSIVTFLLQVKDRHNGNILLDNKGHLIHIDFGFFFLSSPGNDAGFESAPFKLTGDFVDLLGGPDSHTFRTFRELCIQSFLVLRRHWMEIILLVEMLKSGNEELPCFRGRPDDAIRALRGRFRLDLSDRACREYVQSLIDESLENWRTNWYDRYQKYCVGVL